MIFIHHFTWWLAASLGMVLAYLLRNNKLFNHNFIRYFLLFFSLGLFIHVFLVDGLTYSRMYENGVSSFDKYIVQLQHKSYCHEGTFKTIMERVFGDPWNTTYIRDVEKGCE